VSAYTPGPWQSVSSLVSDMRKADGTGGFVIAERCREKARELGAKI